MIVYQETKKKFLNDVRLDLIEEKIERKVLERLHKKTAHNEFLSWMNSMQYMYKVLEVKSIPDDSVIAIEYRIPNSNMRLAVMHNLWFYNHLMERIRDELDAGTFTAFHDKYVKLLDTRI